MHISKMLKVAIVSGTLAVGGAAAGIAGAAAAPTSTTPATPSTPAPTKSAPAPSQTPGTPTKGHCPNMGSGSGSTGGAYSGPEPNSGAVPS
jgi:hypothetical protein